ncbi:hypothetical protein T4A_3286 [Trichinella pseudospiralis]|uniref:Uncharacterized protein n=1 Tax=Trichinella pseudospiralis TaxID=6337 RepID=A0A0V1G297_TRIPS|nr:hypothetical protein T4E_8465 [Trichinella pseudospiralis]KRY78906.1 hypothetical protein T4A_3286 [Trichinella pseudospiralis]KRY92379.1 hypothetical protein T4D_1931 [Trichinella pseudospiralis]
MAIDVEPVRFRWSELSVLEPQIGSLLSCSPLAVVLSGGQHYKIGTCHAYD